MRKKLSGFVLLTVLAMGMIFLATNARADLMGFDLTTVASGNSLAPYPGPYANVQINMTVLDQSSVTVTVTADNGYTFGDAHMFDLNTNGLATASGFSGSGPNGFSSSNISTPGAKNVDGVGSYNLTIDNNGGYSSSLTSLTFTLTDSAGTWADAAAVLAMNSNGYVAAGHIYPAIDSNDSGYAAGVEGAGIAAPLPAVVVATPLPAAILLLGPGLVGLAAIRRRLKNSSNIAAGQGP